MASGPSGKLEPVDLKTAWPHEALDFTPWLAKNINMLGEVLGLPLEVVEEEAAVGPFRADIVCRIISEDANRLVIVENQLEKTNHTHLGQIITYAAGREAAAIVWIAREFTDEHRKAIDWLNRVTHDHLNFFALELELWRIGNSEPAPRLNVVCEPNEWEPGAGPERDELTDTKQAQLAFWTAFKEYLGQTGPLRVGKPRATNVMPFSIGKSGFELIATANSYNEGTKAWEPNIQVQLALNRNTSNDDFATLEGQRDEIEKRLGHLLVWNNPGPDVRLKRIYVRNVTDFADHGQWSTQHSWLKQQLLKFKEVFEPLVKDL